MPVYRLGKELAFPPPHKADPTGLLAVGGDLSPERLLLGYRSGIFPWYEEGLPILWHSPDPRFVLEVDKVVVPRSTKKAINRALYEVRLDTAFDQVMAACGTTKRRGQRGTWITEEMKRAYGELHRRGYAHSVESWQDGKLVGGLYGVSLGKVFFGESMFAHADEASKVAFVTLVGRLRDWGITLIDSQVYTDHLARFGAEEWPRERYLAALEAALDAPTKVGKWA